MNFKIATGLVLALAAMTTHGRAVAPEGAIGAREVEGEIVQEWLGGNNGIHKREEEEGEIVQEWLGGNNGIH